MLRLAQRQVHSLLRVFSILAWSAVLMQADQACLAEPSEEEIPPAPWQVEVGRSTDQETYAEGDAEETYADECQECLDGAFVFEDQPVRESWLVGWLGTRNSSTHGRAIGPGQPLRGTSWLNRPYEVAFELGGLLMAGDPASGVSSANDLFAAIHTGWDWDHYWGGQIRVGWSTPQLENGSATNDSGDNLFIGDISTLYYPWGDSRARPYLRLGIGLTDMEFTNADLQRRQETLFTIPMAIGIKYQFRRWAAWRAEFANNLAIAQGDANTVNNITFTFGVESRFGGRPTGYWAWHPRGHAW